MTTTQNSIIPVNTILHGDVVHRLQHLPSASVDCIVTSPPYYALRDYGVEGQLGLEPTFEKYIEKLCDIFDEAKRVLKIDGTCWVNLGDTYARSMPKKKGDFGKNSKAAKNLDDTSAMRGIKNQTISDKCLIQIPSRFAIEMVNRGWILRNEIIWHKPNCMPSSAQDRFTVDFEKLFFFTKSKQYNFETQYEPLSNPGRTNFTSGSRVHGENADRNDNDLNRRSKDFCFPHGRNKRTVWKISTKPYPGAHFAVYPPELIEIPIKAGCPEGGIVLDPFMGSGTTAIVAKRLGRNYLGIELNPDYVAIARNRIASISTPQRRKVRAA